MAGVWWGRGRLDCGKFGRVCVAAVAVAVAAIPVRHWDRLWRRRGCVPFPVCARPALPVPVSVAIITVLERVLGGRRANIAVKIFAVGEMIHEEALVAIVMAVVFVVAVMVAVAVAVAVAVVAVTVIVLAVVVVVVVVVAAAAAVVVGVAAAAAAVLEARGVF